MKIITSRHEGASATRVSAARRFFLGGSCTPSSPEVPGPTLLSELRALWEVDGPSPAELVAYPLNMFSSTLAAGVSGGSAGLFMGTTGCEIAPMLILGKADTGMEGVDIGVATVEFVRGKE